MSEAAYTVTGMTCGHCADSVTEEITAIAGVQKVDVDVDSGRVTVFSDSPLEIADVRSAVTEAGYELVGA
ncbi:heavy-metal-associated domain-containing protein [Streptomyces sp. TRM68367]|uniref:heavy-metal-associated domain-containing protein n=1 Tax=Streptomyces sp. TRM68367 TaxID=2758415 RepID=UPI00165C11BB|nr:heavy-metal-associated domain-containing protein [Streptomyces sp. TRM68367]MBC9723937.1 heavy-metal-associated domain-containing protein [Streptomyces sp. TRM68367]